MDALEALISSLPDPSGEGVDIDTFEETELSHISMSSFLEKDSVSN
jgi:hypothetical protein